MDDLISSLLQLGLNNKQAKVYLALLQIGSATAYSVSKHAGIKKPTAYVVLDELEERQIVSRIPGARGVRYQPKPPQELFAQARARLEKAEQSLPKMQSLTKGGSEKIQVLYFEGIEGVREAMTYGMKRSQNGELRAFWADVSTETNEIFGHFQEWHNLQKTLNIKIRGFVPEGQIHEEYREKDYEYQRTMKVLARDRYCPFTFFDIGESFVRFFDPTNMQAIVIENPSVADALTQIFELLWDSN